ncbi:MAG: CGNR zinc finger domain-containing protein, partial [bacterium]
VVQFAQTDVAGANKKQIGRLSAGVRRVLSHTEPSTPNSWVKVPTINHAALIDLRARVASLITGIAREGTFETELTLKFWIARDLRPGAAEDSRARGDSSAYVHKVGLLVRGDLTERFLYRVIRLLEHEGAEKIMKCKADDCERLFFKLTRGEYCSTTCQSRIYMRNERAKERSR